MSVRIMAEVWHQPPVSQGKLLVLLALADNADEETRRAWPSVKTLARKTVLSERQVQYCLKALADAGVIEILPNAGPSGTNVYHIYTPSAWGGAKTAGVQSTSPGGEPDCTGGVQPTSPGGVKPIAPEPSIRTIKEPSIEPSERADARQVREVLCSVFSEGTAEDFIAHRKAKRARLTPRAAELIVKKLAEHPDPDAVALLSIENGWTGIFPEKVRTNAQPAPKRSNLELGFIRAVQARTAGG